LFETVLDEYDGSFIEPGVGAREKPSANMGPGHLVLLEAQVALTPVPSGDR
jgi:hypothetical protein